MSDQSVPSQGSQPPPPSTSDRTAGPIPPPDPLDRQPLLFEWKESIIPGGAGAPRVFTATAESTVRKYARCPVCECLYFYWIRRAGNASKRFVGSPPREQVMAQAMQDARRVLATGLQAIPCPQCGGYEPGAGVYLPRDRVNRRDRYIWMRYAGIVAIVIGIVVAAVFSANQLLGVGGFLLFVGGILLIVVQLMLPGTMLDPAAQLEIRRARGLAAIEKSLELARPLTRTNPTVHLPDLALFLHLLSFWRWDHGRRDDALSASREATITWRRLAENSPVRYRQNQVDSLRRYHELLVAMGRFDDAETTQREIDQLG